MTTDLPELCRAAVADCLALCRQTIVTEGGVPTTTVLVKDGQKYVMPTHMYADKDVSNWAVRMTAAEIRPDFIVQVAEAWMVKHENREDAEAGRRPSLDPRREEVVWVSVETHQGLWSATAPISVNAKGRRTFGRLKFERPTFAGGRFAGLLPP